MNALKKTIVYIEKIDDGAKVRSEKDIIYHDDDIDEAGSDIFISEKEWNNILDIFYDKIHLHEWDDDSYGKKEPYGSQWKLVINLTINRKKIYQSKGKLPIYWKELTKIFFKYANFMEYEFYKNNESDRVWHVDKVGCVGPNLVSFDKKRILNLWPDYPWRFSKEEKELFDKENPYWAEFFQDRQ